METAELDGREAGPLPNFLIIGAAKSGTTSLGKYLGAHPEIFVASGPEPNFFASEWITDSRPYVSSQAAYRALFRRVREEKAIGEVSPVYMRFPGVAGQIFQTIPHARIIALLRHPIERAWSNYLMLVRKGRENRSPTDAMDLGSRYAIGSLYYPQLEPYFSAFPSDQIQVCLFEDLRDNPDAVMRDLCMFLKVNPNISLPTHVRYNPGGKPAFPWVHRIVTRPPVMRARASLRQSPSLYKFDQWLTRTVSPIPPVPDEVWERLAPLYESEIDRLSELIGRDMNVWSFSGSDRC